MLFNDQTLRKTLFGKHDKLNSPEKYRSTTYCFPAASDLESEIKIKYRSDDGLILYLLKRIEALEQKVQLIELNKSLENKK